MEFNDRVLAAVADEGDRLGDHPDWSYEEWGNAFASVTGLYAASAGVVGAAGRRIEHLKGVGLGARDPESRDAIEALRGQAHAEGMNARIFVLRLIAMGFDWLELHEHERVKPS